MVRLASSSILSPIGSVCLVWLGACGDGAGSNSPPTSPGRGLVVVNSDFVSTSISLLDSTTGKVANGDCIDSGTRAPGVTLALSGDVVLPSQAQPGDLVLTIDRSNGALTWLDPKTCTPLRQLDVSTGFPANPHDVIGASPTKAYVTRYERNEAPTADPADRDEGDDLLIIDPSVPAITGRIDLSGYAVAMPGATIRARPDRAQLIDGQLIVALANLSDDFKLAAPGRLLVIDTATDRVTGVVDLPGLTSCTGLSYAARSKTLVVACGGDLSAADPAASSGIVYVDLGARPPVELRRQSVALLGGRPLAGYSGIADDGALGFGVTFGEFMGEPKDQFWVVDAAAGSANKLADASDSFTFGAVLVDPAREVVYLTDAAANEPLVRVYSYASAAAPTMQPSIRANPSLGLPPREIAWY